MKRFLFASFIFGALFLNFTTVIAQTDIPPNWIDAINEQSLQKFDDSIKIIFDTIRPNGQDFTKQEKYYHRWLQSAVSRTNYIGSKEGGDLKWKSSISSGSFTCNKQGPSSALWENIGLNPQPGDDQKIGLFRCAEAAGNGFNTIYAGTDHSGLWKTIDGGQNWSNITDDLNLPGLGIYSITVNPNNPDHIIVATTFQEGGHKFIVPVRMLVSTDGGVTFNTVNFVNSTGNPLVFNDAPIEQNDNNNISEHTFFYDVKFHPNQPNVAFAVGGNSIYKTIDGGINWTHLHNVGYAGQGRMYLSDIEFSLSDANTFYVSSNWYPDWTLGGVDEVSPPGVNITSARIYSTTDAGVTWTDITPSESICFDGNIAQSVSSSICIDIRPLEPSTLYACVPVKGEGDCPNNDMYILKSDDNGMTWSNVMTKLFPYGWQPGKTVFEASNSNSGLFYVGSIVFYKTETNNPSNISSMAGMHVDFRDLFQLPAVGGSDRLLTANDGGVSYSETSADSWVNLNGNGLITTQVVGLGVPEKTSSIYVAAIHNGRSRFTEGGPNEFMGGTDGEWMTALKTDEEIYVQDYSNTRFFPNYSTTNTSPTPIGLHNPLRLGLKHYVNPGNEKEIYYGYRNVNSNHPPSNHTNELRRWVRGSAFSSFQILDVLPNTVMKDGNPIPLGPISAVEVAESNQNVMFYATLNPAWGNTDLVYKLRRSTDGGNTWVDLSQNFESAGANMFRWFYIVDFAIDPDNENRVWAVLSGYDDNTKIMYSNDMGNTWEGITYSSNLPPYVIHHIAYYKGSDDVMFIGTDAGVFYWNRNDQEWQCYNNNLPDAIVRKVEIHYCSNSIYAGTHGRGVWKAPIAFDDPTLLSNIETEISTSTIWSTDKFVPNNITITSGNTLTFAPGTKILMGDNNKITIEPGAELIVNGATITNGCSNPWKGIEVLGNSALAQTTANQGKLSTLNNAIIENAGSGVSTIGRNGNVTDWNSTGGILELRNTMFKNNWRAIEFMSYHNYNGNGGEDFNVSLISKCDFVWDDNFMFNHFSLPKHHVTLWDVRGVKFEGNDFGNDISNPVNNLNNYQGVFSLGAWYNMTSTVGGLSNPPIKNTFTDLNVGIHHGSANGYDRVDISDAVFNNNHIGVYAEGASYSEIRTSEFNIREGQGFGEASQGVRIEGSSAHLIHENDFAHSGISGFNGNTGVYVFSADAIGTTNEVYKNNFTDLTTGVEISNNQSTGGNLWLQVDCDNFIDQGTYHSNYASIYLANGEVSDQGDCNTSVPALAITNSFNGIYNLTDKHQMLTYNGSTFGFDYKTYPPVPLGLDPNIWPGNISVINCFPNPPVPNLSDMCPSYIPVITDPIGNPHLTWLSQIEDIEDIEENLSSGLISSSDEDNLIAILQGSGNDYSKEQALLEKAPYLTSKVLREVAVSNLANYRKNNVLKLHYPVDQEVMYDMVNSPNTIAPYILRNALVAGAPVDKKTLIDFFSNEDIPNWAVNDVGVANSPMSDAELISILERANTLEPYRLWNILQLNTPLSDEVEIALTSLDPPTAQWVIDKINSSSYIAPDPSTRFRTERSPLESLNAKLDYYKKERFSIVNKSVRKYLDDNEVDAAITLLENQNSVNASCALVPILLAEKQTKLNTHLQLIKDFVTTLGEDEQDMANDLLKFCDYFEFVAPIQVRTGGYLNLSPDEIDIFKTYAESNISVSAMAASVLRFNGLEVNYHYVEPLPGQEFDPKKSTSVEDTNVDEEEIGILLYPNPNSGSFILEGKLKPNQSEALFVVYDMKGKVVLQESISGNEFRKLVSLDKTSGIYIYSIISNQEIIHRGKVIIR